MSKKVLLVDDDPDLLRLVELYLSEEGIRSVSTGRGREALQIVEDSHPTAVVLDLELPDLSGREVLLEIRKKRPDLPVVVLTSTTDVGEVVACMKAGATDYVSKPVDRTRLVTAVRNARTQGELQHRVDSLVTELRGQEGFKRILGDSDALHQSIELLSRAAQSDVTVLVEGESGTGKEVASRAIHAESPRRSGPFVAVNCGAIPEGLIESELFGHEKGAFTGATSSRRGCFEEADGGTIFLDEIGELRSDLQVRLLRVLQERTIQRVGSSQARSVDVRVLTATNRNLREEVEKGNFRDDLYYRLAIFPVVLPPLRDRGDDVLLLAETFLRRFVKRHRREIRGMSDNCRRALTCYSWPGNVRELENVIERAVILEDTETLSLGSLAEEVVCSLDAEFAPNGRLDRSHPSKLGDTVSTAHLASKLPLDPPFAGNNGRHDPEGTDRPSSSNGSSQSEEIVPFEVQEKHIIQKALVTTGWNVQSAASRLGIGRATIYRKIEKYGLRQDS